MAARPALPSPSGTRTFLIALHSQKAAEDDEHDNEDAREAGDRFKGDGNRTSLNGERGTVGLVAQDAHAQIEQGHNPGHPAEHE